MFRLFLFITLFTAPGGKSPQKAVFLSMFLPGGGQFYTGHYVKGTLIALGEIYTFTKFYELYKDAGKFPSGEPQRDTLLARSFSYGFWFLGIWFFSMLDAYVDAHLYDFDKKTGLSLSFYPDKNAIFLRVKVPFKGFW